MYTDLHTDFILTTIRSILEQGITASQSLSLGIESYPISEYLLQSIFLRMTGASEQKIKCIFWQMATDDVQYRYKYLGYQNLGECSSYFSKNTAFRDLLAQITKLRPDFEVNSIWDDYKYDISTIDMERAKWETKAKANKQKQINSIKQKRIDAGSPMSQSEIAKMTTNIMSETLKEEDFQNHLSSNKRRARIAQVLEELFQLMVNTNFEVWRASDLSNYHKYCQKTIKGSEVAGKKDLLQGTLVDLYDNLVYLHRNRIAHNTVVYQKNKPVLETISAKNYYLLNYFFRFAIILVMDEVFNRLYKAYMEVYSSKV